MCNLKFKSNELCFVLFLFQNSISTPVTGAASIFGLNHVQLNENGDGDDGDEDDDGDGDDDDDRDDLSPAPRMPPPNTYMSVACV